MSGKKPKKQLLDPREVREQSTIDWQRNNPNVSNYYGSTNTTFDGNQANVTQQYSEPVQGIIDQRTDFLSRGPTQLGDTGSPMLMEMFMNAANNVNRRNGDPQQSGKMGGGQQSMPMPKPGLDDVQAQNKPLAVQGEQPMNGAMPVNPYQRVEQMNTFGGAGGGGGSASGIGGLAQLLSDWGDAQNRAGSRPPLNRSV